MLLGQEPQNLRPGHGQPGVEHVTRSDGLLGRPGGPRQRAAYHGAGSQGCVSFTVAPTRPRPGRSGVIQAGG